MGAPALDWILVGQSEGEPAGLRMALVTLFTLLSDSVFVFDFLFADCSEFRRFRLNSGAVLRLDRIDFSLTL